MTLMDEDVADRLGLEPGQIVREIGWDEDSDHDLREAAAARTGTDLMDENYDDTVDIVLLWLRDGDADLCAVLSEALVSLACRGCIWLLTPKVGRGMYVKPSAIAEAATSAGLARTRFLSVSGDWYGTRLAVPKRRV
ncbi:DUF3052 domain-containing protein [Streptomyces sp. 1222.5]|uniref:DUF3052 domain-containing protein n=1 Tax=Streptomyces sp. 1222.5 TaxID=1881026 RepID=UPI003EC03903